MFSAILKMMLHDMHRLMLTDKMPYGMNTGEKPYQNGMLTGEKPL